MFDFQPVLDDLDTVPDKFKGLYSAGDDGKFNLDSDLADKLGKGAGAHRALNAERAAKNAAEKALKKFKEVSGLETPEELEARIAELEAGADKAASAEDRVAAVKADLERTYNNKVSTLEQTLASEREANDRDYRDREISDTISSVDAIPEALKPILRERVAALRDDNGRRLVIRDAEGGEVLDGHGNPITLKAYVEKLKADEKYGFAFKPSNALGAGTGNGNGPRGIPGVNPFAEKTRNLTEAQALITSNPERARALAQQAGYPVNW